MAVISTALLVESPASLFASTTAQAGLTEKWRRFWQLQGGAIQSLQQPLKDAAIQKICNGHNYKIGTAIYFADENILAQPIWIYWSEQKSEPNDVIISFFTKEDEPKKICRINRYELETLHHLAINGKEQHLVALCKANAIHSKQDNNTNGALFVKTEIRKNEPVKIFTVFNNQGNILEQEIIYNA